MAIPGRLRYEILRRDNYTCRYCGGKAPDVQLTIDHVTPTVLGGSDDPSNLVAACKQCNGGKSSSSPDAPLVAQVSDDAVRWASAIKEAARQLDAEKAASYERVEPWIRHWTKIPRLGRSYDLPRDWEPTIHGFLDAGLSMSNLIAAADIALSAPRVQGYRFPYFVGIANNKLRDLEERAVSLLARPIKVTPDAPQSYADYVFSALSETVDGGTE